MGAILLCPLNLQHKTGHSPSLGAVDCVSIWHNGLDFQRTLPWHDQSDRGLVALGPDAKFGRFYPETLLRALLSHFEPSTWGKTKVRGATYCSLALCLRFPSAVGSAL